MKSKTILGVMICTLILAVAVSGCTWPPSGPSGDDTSKPLPNSGYEIVRLGMGPGEGWYIYQGTSNDPIALRSKPHATITSVTNNDNYEFSIAHVDRNGRQTGFIILQPGATDSLSFTGLEVEGSWTAQIKGTRVNAPSSLGVKVGWKAP